MCLTPRFSAKFTKSRQRLQSYQIPYQRAASWTLSLVMPHSS